MWRLIFIPFLIQGIAIGIDEVYFHRKRGLPKWERIGHPIDTLSLLACILFVLLVPYSGTALKGFIALAILSCLMVTKDEFVHKHHCPGAEHWLHALLFLNHPVLLTAIGLMWPSMHGLKFLDWLNYPMEIKIFLFGLSGSVLLFALYQIIYWNWIWKDPQSTMPSTNNLMKNG